MEKLDSPMLIQSDLGPITATHVSRVIQINDQPGNHRIISTKVYAIETANGIKEIPGTQESVDIVEADLDALGENPALNDIIEKHGEIADRLQDETGKAKADRIKSLQAQVDAANAELSRLQ